MVSNPAAPAVQHRCHTEMAMLLRYAGNRTHVKHSFSLVNSTNMPHL